MKRMNEVFDLPIDEDELALCMAFSSTIDEEEAIAHAINHVDALADALKDVLEMAWILSEDDKAEFNQRTPVIKAKTALAAYRGEK